MKLCFPIKEALSLDSEVYGHFGSAPVFVIVDAQTKEERTIMNNDQHHAHGMCNPVGALSGNHVDAVIVGGIGMGALAKLKNSGIRVYKATALTVKENIELFNSDRLPEFAPGHVCKGGGGCSHH